MFLNNKSDVQELLIEYVNILGKGLGKDLRTYDIELEFKMIF